MKIRLAKDEDYAEIARLRRQTIRQVNSRDYPEKIIHQWSSRGGAKDFRTNADSYKRWVALDKNKILGFSEHSLKCELTRIYVHKDYLEKGIGSRLLKIAEDSLRKYECKEINVESTVTAKAFYERNGYEVIRKGRDKEDGAPVYKMIKRMA